MEAEGRSSFLKVTFESFTLCLDHNSKGGAPRLLQKATPWREGETNRLAKPFVGFPDTATIPAKETIVIGWGSSRPGAITLATRNQFGRLQETAAQDKGEGKLSYLSAALFAPIELAADRKPGSGLPVLRDYVFQGPSPGRRKALKGVVNPR